MAAVAEPAILGMFATAPGDRLILGDIHLLRRKGRAFMGSVAKRLPLGKTTGAEIIGADFHRQDKR